MDAFLDVPISLSMTLACMGSLVLTTGLRKWEMAGMQGGMFSHIFCDGAKMKTQSLSRGNCMLLTARGRVSVVRRRLRIGESLLVSTPRCDSSSRTYLDLCNFAKRVYMPAVAGRSVTGMHLAYQTGKPDMSLNQHSSTKAEARTFWSIGW